jgi:GT2 family glycosyltransferase
MTIPQAPPRIQVLLPVHNRRAITERFIRCLVAQTYASWHLILIDDGSSDGTAEMARALVPDLTVLRGDGTWWWAGSLHQGYRWLRRHRAAQNDIVLIINDDTEFDADFFSAAATTLTGKRRTLLLAQLYDLATVELVEVGTHADWRRLTFTGVVDPQAINCFSTRGLFLWLEDMREIGGFHPRILPHYLSDYEYTMRAHAKGFSLLTSPAVNLRYDSWATGIRKLERQPLVPLLKAALSRKSASNPIYWTSFVLLACRARYIPINLLRIWWRFFNEIRAAL